MSNRDAAFLTGHEAILARVGGWLAITALIEGVLIQLEHGELFDGFGTLLLYILAVMTPVILVFVAAFAWVRWAWRPFLHGGAKPTLPARGHAIWMASLIMLLPGVGMAALLGPSILSAVRTEWIASFLLGAIALIGTTGAVAAMWPIVYRLLERGLMILFSHVKLLNRLWFFFGVLGLLALLLVGAVSWWQWELVREQPWWLIVSPLLSTVVVAFGGEALCRLRKRLPARQVRLGAGVLVLALMLLSLVSYPGFVAPLYGALSPEFLDATSLTSLVASKVKEETDWDEDGSSAWLDGQDCAPRDAKIGPTSFDVPEDGIDQDCSGEDARPLTDTYSRGKFSHADELEPMLAKKRPKYIIVLTTDALSYAHTSMGGYSRDVTPELAKFASNATSFTHAYSTGPSTRLAMPGIFMGHFNAFASLDLKRSHPYGWNTKENTTLAEHFKARKWRTVQVLGDNYFKPGKWPGLSQGFDVVDSSALRKKARSTSGHNARAVSDAILAQLDAHEAKHPDKPLFLWAHYFDHHSPFKHPAGEEVVTYGKGEIDRYDEELHATDREWGRVFEAIAKRWKPEEYVIVFTSDHGEAFTGKHHHGYTLRSVVLDVPLIFQTAWRRGDKVEGLVSHLDILPTLSDLAGLGVKPTEEQVGESLAGAIVSEGMPEKDYVTAVYYVPEESKKGRRALKKISVRTREHYLIRDLKSGKHSFYGGDAKTLEDAPVIRGSTLKKSKAFKELKLLLAQETAWVERLEDGLAVEKEAKQK